MYFAEELAEFICELEPTKREDVDFILLHTRAVNSPFAAGLGKTIREKFANYATIKCRRFGTGWPLGCNDLWQDGMRQIARMKREGRITSDAVLTFEPDCIPLRRDWINVLIAEWLKARELGKSVCGYLADGTHINGNAIFAANITTINHNLLGSSGKTGWDFDHAPYLLANAYITPYIMQIYRINFIRWEKLAAIRNDGEVPALFHGIKDGLGVKCAREMIKQGVYL